MAIYFRTASSVLRNSTRSLATMVSSPSSSNQPPALASVSTPLAEEHEGPLRSHLNIPVNPNHGLYGFFRLKTNDNSHSKPRNDGQPEYIAIEPPGSLSTSGTSHAIVHCTNDLYEMSLKLSLYLCLHKVDRGIHQNSGVNRSRTFTHFGISYFGSGTYLRHKKQSAKDLQCLRHCRRSIPSRTEKYVILFSFNRCQSFIGVI